MIGVISKAHQAGVVDEFFELFKTPWEHYRVAQPYDVVIATVDAIPEVEAKLLLVYGSATKNTDNGAGIHPGKRGQRAKLVSQGVTLPIFGEIVTFNDDSHGESCVTANRGIVGLRITKPNRTSIRLGYDLFDEVHFLLSIGQPVEYADIPTLDIHIKMLREWILGAEVPLLEILPTPAGYSFGVCLTHDIDFVGIRKHLLDHSMWGFVYRATVVALLNFTTGKISGARLLKCWGAFASLPLVYTGLLKDFWEPFQWYLNVEKDLPTTYFLIPFKRRAGENVPGRYASRRAAAYGVDDIPQWVKLISDQGCEVGVHGIDAWHDASLGRSELVRIASATGASEIGVRMHWLLRDADTPTIEEQAGFSYDSTFGYNETIGYRAGIGQVFKPLEAQALMELPLHIQDGAMFYPQQLNLTEPEAENRCLVLIDNAKKFGGILTLLWHDRSHGPERFWGDFYVALVKKLKSLGCWFTTGLDAVNWFRKRRDVRFLRSEANDTFDLCLSYSGQRIQPELNIRIHRPGRRPISNLQGHNNDFVDVPWDGQNIGVLNNLLYTISSTQDEVVSAPEFTNFCQSKT